MKEESSVAKKEQGSKNGGKISYRDQLRLTARDLNKSLSEYVRNHMDRPVSSRKN